MKQAAKMQKKMQALQEELAQQEIEVASGGGAVKVRITLQQEVRSLTLDPEFLREDKAFIEETILEGVRAAYAQSREQSEQAMNAIAEGMQIPGLSGMF